MPKKSGDLKVKLESARASVREMEEDLKKALAAEADPAKARTFVPGWSDRTREGLKKAKEEEAILFEKFMTTYD